MKRLARVIELVAWVAFFAFAALVLAVRFWVLPDVERYRGDIVAAISTGVGLPVKVGAIEAGWLGLRPQITLTDVRIYDSQGGEALVLPSIHNVIGWRSVLAGELRLHRVTIEGPRLAVRRDAAGQLFVAGLAIASQPGAGGGFGGWLLGQSEIVIRNAEIEWRDESRGAPPLVLGDLELTLENSGSSHALGLKARLPEELGSSLELRAVLEGKAAAAPSGRVFMQLGHADLDAWRAWVDYPVEIRRGHGTVRAWVTLENGRFKAGTADVALAELRVSLADELAPLELLSVQGRVSGRALPDGVELSGRGLALAMERGTVIPKTDFQIVWRPQAGGTIVASAIDLEALGQLAESLPLPPQIASRLAELAPRGRLSEARLEWAGPFDAPARFTARLRFADLALQAREAVPGFSGLSGSLEATQEKGKLRLSSRKAALDLPRVFPEPRLEFDTLAGEASWERVQGMLAVRVSSLSFANEHASGNLYGTYTHRGEGPGNIDLSAVLNRADGRAVARYLPHAALMGEATRRWLVAGIVAGEGSDVRVRLRGDLRQFPFIDPASGLFQVTARVEKGVLDYAAGWPRIEDIAGELTFERDRMEIVGRGGAIFGARLSNVRVAIPSLRGPDARLLVSGEAEGPSADFLKFVAASPVREKAGDFVAGMQAAGNGKLRLKVDLPFAEPAKTRVTGDYEFAGNQVDVVSWLPPIGQAAGRFAFTDSSFTLHGVRGRLMGGAVTVSGGTRGERRLEILARGDASFDGTRTVPFLDHPLRKHVSGTFTYAVTVQAQDGLARVRFDSPLRGIASALPAPLTKSAAEPLPLRIEVVPLGRGERDRVSISLGTLARAEMSRRREADAMVVQRTGVWLSPQRDQQIRLPERPGTLVYGSLPEFNLDGWLPLLSGEEAGARVALDLNVGAFDAFGRRFLNLALRAGAEPSRWSANVKADELAGDLSYRGGQRPRLVARLAHLTVPDESPLPARRPRAPLRPSELPALDLVADDFTFEGKQLGRFELQANRSGDDWRIESMKMTNPDASFSGHGVWRAVPSQTALEFDINAADVGRYLARVGQPGSVKGGRAQMHGSLVWQGSPATLDFPSLTGEVSLRAEDGQFLELEPGIGKLIGLMSLQALPRRVTLDFSDVFSKGFQFDRITSGAQLEQGVIRLKEFRMRGSAADVEMSGDADINHETQNLRVRVVPSLGDSAAIGVALVNPVAGVAAAIAQRLLKNPLGQIFAYDYSVTGSWADPKVIKILPKPATEPVSN